ncbi:hypothetical protein LINGRAHAP2_LOCUS35554 [Linum grandiflorum]
MDGRPTDCRWDTVASWESPWAALNGIQGSAIALAGMMISAAAILKSVCSAVLLHVCCMEPTLSDWDLPLEHLRTTACLTLASTFWEILCLAGTALLHGFHTPAALLCVAGSI